MFGVFEVVLFSLYVFNCDFFVVVGDVFFYFFAVKSNPGRAVFLCMASVLWSVVGCPSARTASISACLRICAGSSAGAVKLCKRSGHQRPVDVL